MPLEEGVGLSFPILHNLLGQHWKRILKISQVEKLHSATPSKSSSDLSSSISSILSTDVCFTDLFLQSLF